MKGTLLLVFVLFLLLPQPSWGFIGETSFEDSVWDADAVVIAKPVTLKKLEVSKGIGY